MGIGTTAFEARFASQLAALRADSAVTVLHLEAVVPASTRGAFDLWDHAATDLAHFHAHVEDFALTSPPARATLSSCPAVTYAARYTVPRSSTQL